VTGCSAPTGFCERVGERVKGQEGERGQSLVGFAMCFSVSPAARRFAASLVARRFAASLVARRFAAWPAARRFAVNDSGGSRHGGRAARYRADGQCRPGGSIVQARGCQYQPVTPAGGSCAGRGLPVAGMLGTEERLNKAAESLQIVNVARPVSVLSRHQVWMGRERWRSGCTPLWMRWRPPGRFQSRSQMLVRAGDVEARHCRRSISG